MALEAPLRSSTGSIISNFLPHADMSVPSPDTSHAESDGQSLRPNSFIRSHSSHLLMSPASDIVGPSPVTSNGTESTEIEDDIAEEDARRDRAANSGSQAQLMMLRTNIPDHLRKSSSEEAVSVIHAPQGFQSWPTSEPDKSTISADGTVSPPSSEISSKTQTKSTSGGPAPPPISTNVKPVKFGTEAPTPQAQNLQDVINDSARLRASTASSLELIPEHHGETEGEDQFDDDEDEDFDPRVPMEEDSEVRSLWTALEECWTLCNTLANLSSIHRKRVFNNSGTPDAHEKAWKSCWKLCKRLYLSRDDTSESFNVRTNLDLCRDFCQALFDVRQRQDEIADSVLRVSFELNTHLYSAQDSRNLPEAFRERTLDFYITLCHRLMKQRSELAEETDALLRACWSLAEMLFSLRQNRRDGKAPDEELLGSAVQACWELCDIFREGWTAVRPDRGTPRPNQVSFFSQGFGVASDNRSNTGSRTSMHSKRDSLRSFPDERSSRKAQPPVPETPVTEFEDTPISPESSSPQMPNIMVLGTDSRSSTGGGTGRWSSSASQLSSYSQSSAKTSSTATTATATEDINITRLKVLILKAAMNIGFSRDAADANGGSAASLQTFVKSLPAGSFGSLSSHATLLQNYKNLVLSDTSFRTTTQLPSRGKRISSSDMAKSVGWMMLRSSGQYGFLRELFKLVFSFPMEDADSRKNVSIAV